MNVGQRIGQGQTAEIYALDSTRVVKLFLEDIPYDVAQREAMNTRMAHEAGLPVPFVHDITSVDNQAAIIYERIDGRTMFSQVSSRLWTLRRNALRFANLHAEIHEVQGSGIRSFRGRLTEAINEVTDLAQDVRHRVLTQLESLPRANVLCHGDFHPANVLLTDEKPVIIDWLDGGSGHPAADVARTNLILKFAGQQQTRLHPVVQHLFRRWYLRTYLRQAEFSRSHVNDWELPIAVARLTEDVPEESDLRSFITSQLEDK